MPSMFERISKKMVKEFGSKELRPVEHFLNASQIRPFSILRKEVRSWFWERDVPLEVSLMHILEPSPSVPDTDVKLKFQFSITEVNKWKADVSVNARAEVRGSGEVTGFQETSFPCQVVNIPYETWTDLQKRKLLDPEPPVLRQCREKDKNLYVVTEIMEVIENSVLQDISNMNISGKISFSLNNLLKGEGEGECLKVREKKMTVPQGTVVAYKRKQLVFKEDGWEIVHIADDAKQKTFPEEKWQMRSHIESFIIGPILPIGRIQEPFWLDFKCLQEEISQKEQEAQQFKDIQDVVFSNMLAVLRDGEDLQDLVDMLEEEPLGHLSGPGGTILDELRKDSGCQWVNPKYFILYLLEAIMVLSDSQHDLLAQSMERKILSQQRDLVRSILEPNFRYPWRIPFTLKPELLAPLQGEGLAITCGLLEACGLTVELPGPRSIWDLEAKKPLSALYATLSVLQQLAGA